MPSFFTSGVTTGTYAERLALSSPSLGQVFYQTDTDEYLKFVNFGGVNRWMQADVKSGRNKLMNGEFRVWQRGTSVSNMGSSRSSAYSADRWESYRGGYQTGITISRQAGTGQFKYAARVQRVNGNAATEYMFFNQIMESFDSSVFVNKYVTLSYWARRGNNYSSNVNNRLISQVTTGTGSDQNFRGGITGNVAPAYLEQPLTTSWTFYSVSGLCASNITQVGCQFYYVPSGTAGVEDWFEITGVQMEVGTAPSEFEFIPFSEDLNKCQRYYQAYSGIYMANAYDDDYGRQLGHVNFPVSMRINPDIQVLSGGMDGHHGTAPAAYNSGANHAYFNWTGAAVRAPSAAAWCSFTASADF